MPTKPVYKDLQQRAVNLERESRKLIRTGKALKARVEELEAKKYSLELANKALKVLLRQRDEDSKRIEEGISSDVRELALPSLRNLKESELDPKQRLNVDVLEASLKTIASPFYCTLFTRYETLTPMEIQIAHLIREGRRNREIAALMHTSPRTVDSARNIIRGKMGLRHKKGHLRTHLQKVALCWPEQGLTITEQTGSASAIVLRAPR